MISIPMFVLAGRIIAQYVLPWCLQVSGPGTVQQPEIRVVSLCGEISLVPILDVDLQRNLSPVCMSGVDRWEILWCGRRDLLLFQRSSKQVVLTRAWQGSNPVIIPVGTLSVGADGAEVVARPVADDSWFVSERSSMGSARGTFEIVTVANGKCTIDARSCMFPLTELEKRMPFTTVPVAEGLAGIVRRGVLVGSTPRLRIELRPTFDQSAFLVGFLNASSADGKMAIIMRRTVGTGKRANSPPYEQERIVYDVMLYDSERQALELFPVSSPIRERIVAVHFIGSHLVVCSAEDAYVLDPKSGSLYRLQSSCGRLGSIVSCSDDGLIFAWGGADKCRMQTYQLSDL